MSHDQAAPPAAPRRRFAWRWFVLAPLAVAALAGLAAYWFATRNEVSTDDAFTDGDAIVIAPQVAGTVTDLAVSDNQRVHAGQMLLQHRSALLRRRPRPGARPAGLAEAALDDARAALDLARVVFPARLASARAQRVAAEARARRARPTCAASRTGRPPPPPQQARDDAVATAAVAEATLSQTDAAVAEAQPIPPNIAEAEAQVHSLEGQLAEARAAARRGRGEPLVLHPLTAPEDGWVTQTQRRARQTSCRPAAR